MLKLSNAVIVYVVGIRANCLPTALFFSTGPFDPSFIGVPEQATAR